RARSHPAGGQSPICSKRRSKATPKTVNQIAKNLKSRARRINQRFFDPSRLLQLNQWALSLRPECLGDRPRHKVASKIAVLD
ncbi:hypothetical protein, partial [Acetobacter malorum]|uniref:hypothetical protein n=1 Tax=Acetobacter malorum TaxID=178901 RepID=UPI001E5A5036